MHLTIGIGQIARKDHIGAKIDLRATITGKCESCRLVNARCSGTDATASGKRFQYFKTSHAKLFLLLRVLPVKEK